MILARVVGTVVATRKDPRLEGKKLLVLRPVTPDDKFEAAYATPPEPAAGGIESSLRFLPREVPADATIVAIVASVQIWMVIARVIGEIVATEKHASHIGRKALLVQPLNLDGSDRGDAVIALDSVDAGAG